jgi:hypothetical protein
MMRRTALVPWAVALLTGGLLTGGLVAGCTADPSSASASGCGTGTGARARDASFAEVLALSAPNADYAWYPETVTAALPSVTYSGGGVEDAHASELAAVGKFTGWEEGEQEYETVRMIDLAFEVAEVVDALGDLAGLEGTAVTVHVGVNACTDVGRVADELVELDDVVLFLNHVGPESWPPPEWDNVYGGAFLGDVRDDGTVTWPVADAIRERNPADAYPEADAATLDELRVLALLGDRES